LGTDSAEASITTRGNVRLVTSTLVSMTETAQAKKGDHRPVTQHLGHWKHHHGWYAVVPAVENV